MTGARSFATWGDAQQLVNQLSALSNLFLMFLLCLAANQTRIKQISCNLTNSQKHSC